MNADIADELRETDGKGAAHPAYWRGHEDCVAGICRHVVAILDGTDNGSGVAYKLWEPVRLIIAKLGREREHLTTALHANRCHPDYSYVTVPVGTWFGPEGFNMAAAGFERCPEAETAGSGDEVWRRLK